ncbi:MAG: molybdopterin-guanine dinucleotide biosynthesis protein B [Rhodospirillaceae bacterium]|nr:molybdopterin-guanine dinucleotide biosynthesis protein B [Rhodospirillaceae bacterium]MBT5677745.1 molybdopterin-guanine dinucleotide biosynthesis protein B [Rhodospirillaceae bacterium]
MTLVGICGGGLSEQAELTRSLVAALRARDKSVSVIAYAGASTEIDIPGKDSYEHRRAGAREVLAVSRLRWALVHESDTPARPEMAELLARLDPVDVVLAPGFENAADVSLVLNGEDGAMHATHAGQAETAFQLDRTEQITDFILSPPPEKNP